MGDRVQEILSWYGSDNAGTKTNIARMLRSGKLSGPASWSFSRLIRIRAWSGSEFCPRIHPGTTHSNFQLAIDAGCNAYAAPLGFLEAGASEFAGQIPLILKLNKSAMCCMMIRIRCRQSQAV